MSTRPQHRTNGNLFGPQQPRQAELLGGEAKPQHAVVGRLRDVMGRVHDQLAPLPREERKRVLRALLALEGEP